MSSFWSIYIIVLVVICIVGTVALLHWTKNMHADDESSDGKMPHSYDGIEEYNKPLPRWWLWMFYLTIIFSIGYLVLYPGLGSFAGTLGWSQVKEHDADVQALQAKVQPMYQAMAQQSIEELAKDANALSIGQRLFAANCATCHGSDASGALGFPNLTDNDWLYGGDPQNIEQTILHGRTGAMPAFAASLDDKSRMNVKHYVLSLSKREHDATSAALGKVTFAGTCAACHGADGKGNSAMGAPNLSDGLWLYGGTHAALDDTIKNGRAGKMPAHGELLGAEKVHVLAAYVYSLSQEKP